MVNQPISSDIRTMPPFLNP